MSYNLPTLQSYIYLFHFLQPVTCYLISFTRKGWWKQRETELFDVGNTDHDQHLKEEQKRSPQRTKRRWTITISGSHRRKLEGRDLPSRLLEMVFLRTCDAKLWTNGKLWWYFKDPLYQTRRKGHWKNARLTYKDLQREWHGHICLAVNRDFIIGQNNPQAKEELDALLGVAKCQLGLDVTNRHRRPKSGLTEAQHS